MKYKKSHTNGNHAEVSWFREIQRWGTRTDNDSKGVIGSLFGKQQ